MIEHKTHDARSFLRSRNGLMLTAACGMLLACGLAWIPGQRYFRGQFYFPEQHALNLTRSLDEKSFLVCDDLFEFGACLEVRLMEPAARSSVILQKKYLNQRWYVAEFIAHEPELLFSNTTGPIDTILKGFVLNNREGWEIHWSRAAIPVDWKEPQAFPSGLTLFFQAQSDAPVDPAKFQYRYDLTALPENSTRLDPQTKSYLSRYTSGFTAMGNKLMEQERYSDAIHAFDRAVRLDPSLDEPRDMLSRIYSERKILEAAELDFERVIKDRPAELADVMDKLAQAQKDRDEAASMRYLEEMIRSNARLADAQYQLSKIYEERGRSKEAKALLRASVELNPQQIGAQMAMGHYLAKIGKRLEAEQAFRAVLIIDPQNKQAQVEIWKLLNQS
jgi:tetratricopeptide (TPR) repeat protein